DTRSCRAWRTALVKEWIGKRLSLRRWRFRRAGGWWSRSGEVGRGAPARPLAGPSALLITALSRGRLTASRNKALVTPRGGRRPGGGSEDRHANDVSGQRTVRGWKRRLRPVFPLPPRCPGSDNKRGG